MMLSQSFDTPPHTPSDHYEVDVRRPEMQALIDQIGHFFDRFGFRRNLGRIWSVIYLSPRPLDQAEIGSYLDLSAGLVCASLKELEHWGAIRVVSVSGARSKCYEAEERLLSIVASILAKRECEAVRGLRDRARAVRVSGWLPEGYARRFESRLRAIEHTADLYEALSGLIGRMASLPMSAIDQTIRVVKMARFLVQKSRSDHDQTPTKNVP
jgi:DNA-binding transcriptional regulator GbsR (MarR family)